MYGLSSRKKNISDGNVSETSSKNNAFSFELRFPIKNDPKKLRFPIKWSAKKLRFPFPATINHPIKQKI